MKADIRSLHEFLQTLLLNTTEEKGIANTGRNKKRTELSKYVEFELMGKNERVGYIYVLCSGFELNELF